MALSIFSGKGVQDLRSITAYVDEGKNSWVVDDSTGAYNLSSSSTSYAPDIFADTVLDRLNGIGKYAKPEGVDWELLALSKRFCKNNGFGFEMFMDGVIADLTSWRQFWVDVAPYSLLEFARIGGKETLIPAIPVKSTGEATREITISALFTAGNILEDSYKEEFIDYGDATQDLIATVIYRETETRDVFPRNASIVVSLVDTNENDAIRTTFDASQFITQKEQAILFGKFLCNQRRWVKRGNEFKTFPTDSPISPGSYIYVDVGLVSWDAITSGLIMEGGALNAPLTPQIADGTYSVLIHKSGEEVVSLDSITVANSASSQLASFNGYLFVLGAKTQRKRVFRTTEVQMDEEGEVTVKAVEHPCDNENGTLLSKIANFSDALFKGDEFACGEGDSDGGDGSPPIFDNVTIVGNFSPTGSTSYVAVGVWTENCLNRGVPGCSGPYTNAFGGSGNGSFAGGLAYIAYVNEPFGSNPGPLEEICGGYSYAGIKAYSTLGNSQYIVGLGGDNCGKLFWTGTITFSTTASDSTPASQLPLFRL
jgi:hypothetical protein